MFQPGEFEKLVTDSVQRIKESALETERKELSVLTNSTAKQELTSLTNKIFLNFVQVCFLFQIYILVYVVSNGELIFQDGRV